MTLESAHAAGALVSVIVPVYNAAGFLEKTVGSIQAQTHAALQIILVDDGSADGSGTICDNLAAADSRVTVIHQTNHGIAAAQNAGLDAARGEFITFCDNDDLMAPRLVERLLALLLETDADMSCCRWLNLGASVAEDGLRAHADDPPGKAIMIDDPARAYQHVFSLAHRKLCHAELRYFSEANWGKLYRRELWQNVRFPESRFAQDVAVSLDLYLQMRRVASCADALYIWIQRPQSVSHRTKTTSYFHDIVRAHGHAFELSLEAGIVPARAYGGLMTLRLERASVRTASERRMYAEDARYVESLMARLTWEQRALCRLLFVVRRAETAVYRLTVHRRR